MFEPLTGVFELVVEVPVVRAGATGRDTIALRFDDEALVRGDEAFAQVEVVLGCHLFEVAAGQVGEVVLAPPRGSPGFGEMR